MEKLENRQFGGERALYRKSDLELSYCVFNEGESCLKEGRNLKLDHVEFRWKYPLWCCRNVEVSDSLWQPMGRSGIWYTENLQIRNCLIEAPKNFRRCANVTLENTNLTDAQETFWSCRDVTLKNVCARGDYFGMNCEKMDIDHLQLAGNYCFDGAKDLVIRDSVLMSKDALWNTENVTVYNSVISGEYLGWHSKNLKLVNCTISSEQGLCYAENLVLENCRLMDTTLCFEYSTVQADIAGSILSVKNPAGGSIVCDGIESLEVDPDVIDPSRTQITERNH